MKPTEGDIVGPRVQRREPLLGLATATTAIKDSVGSRAVPRHPNEETSIMTEIRRPEVLGVGHERMEILLEAPVVECLERGGIIKILVLRVGGIRVLAEDIELQGIGPPVGVAARSSVPRAGRDSARGVHQVPEVIPSATSSNIALLVCNRTFSHDVYWTLKVVKEERAGIPANLNVRVGPITGRVLSSLLILSAWPPYTI